MRTYRYHRVDVFTDRPFGGNPLAVFPAAEGLDGREMQIIAREMNLSETVFVLPPTHPQADVRMRIFTVDRELPLAGHPVVGAHFVLATTGRYQLDREVTLVHGQLEAGVLPVEIIVEDGRVSSVVMTQNLPTVSERITDLDMCAAALGLRRSQLEVGDLVPRVVDTGVPWLIVPLVDLRAIQSIATDTGRCQELAQLVGTDMFYAFTQETEHADCAVHARHIWFGTVTPGEDPVTGSAAGCLASFLVTEGVLLAQPVAEVWIEQGLEVGRPGKVQALVDVEGGVIRQVCVGGSAVHLGDGEIRF
jgi:trans-2,3-dihydro-3-hydroxyanthranilate isomerase